MTRALNTVNAIAQPSPGRQTAQSVFTILSELFTLEQRNA